MIHIQTTWKIILKPLNVYKLYKYASWANNDEKMKIYQYKASFLASTSDYLLLTNALR